LFTKQVFAAVVCALALAVTPGAVQCEITPFSDDFNDANSSVNYTVTMSTADNDVTFAYDYSELGIPVAPSTTDSSTMGLRLQSNLESPTGVESVTLHTLATYDAGADGDFTVSFDLWENANGPFPTNSNGGEHFFTAGVSGDGSTVNNFPDNNGSGVYVAASTMGIPSRDYRLYKPNINDGEQDLSSGQYGCGTTAGCQNSSNAYYANFGSIDVGLLQGPGTTANGTTDQTGITRIGSLGFEWHQVLLAVDADGSSEDGGPAVSWFIDGLLIGTLISGVDGQDSWEVNGTVTLGNLDDTDDVATVPMFNFTLIDNLEISAGLPTFEAIKGDMNNDGNVTAADVPLFIQALVDLAAYQSAYPFIDGPTTGDVNNDTVFDFGDLQAFRNLLLSEATANSWAVPEPTSAILLLAALSCVVIRGRKQT